MAASAGKTSFKWRPQRIAVHDLQLRQSESRVCISWHEKTHEKTIGQPQPVSFCEESCEQETRRQYEQFSILCSQLVHESHSHRDRPSAALQKFAMRRLETNGRPTCILHLVVVSSVSSFLDDFIFPPGAAIRIRRTARRKSRSTSMPGENAPINSTQSSTIETLWL